MNTNPQYFRVGLFVILGVTLLIAFLVVLGSGAFFGKNVKMESYFDESVQGLDVGSAVKHRGVKIGFVEEITFIRKEYGISPSDNAFFEQGRLVLVKMSIPDAFKGIPPGELKEVIRRMIDDGLRVRLASQGLTGTAYLELDYLSPEKNPPMKINWVPKTHYVPSAKSTMTRLSASVNDFFDKLDKADVSGLIQKINELIVAVTSEVESLHLGELSSESKLLIQEFRKTNAELKGILSQPELKRTPKKLEDAISQLSSATKRLDTILSSNQGDLSQSIENLRIASEDLKEVTANAKKYPSLIFFGEPPSKTKAVKP